MARQRAYTYNTIVVGTNDYRLAKVIREAIAEDSSWTLIEDEYLDALPQFAVAQKAFLVLSPEALADTDGAVWLDRIKLTIKSYVDENNDANIWAGRARYGAGFVTYRHIAVATLKSLTKASTLPGVVGGQTITDKASLADRHGVKLSDYSFMDQRLHQTIGTIVSLRLNPNCTRKTNCYCQWRYRCPSDRAQSSLPMNAPPVAPLIDNPDWIERKEDPRIKSGVFFFVKYAII